MKMLKSILLAGGAVLACAAVAQAADLPTKKEPAPAPKPNCYATFWTWMDSTPADCPLTAAGITLYGQVDVGFGYETNASRFDRYAVQGVSELIANTSHGGKWQLVPNGLSQSNLGVKWKEPIVSDWFFIGDVNFGYDPYSLRFSDGPRSLEDNNTLAQIDRSTNGDSSRTYGPINTRAYAGFSNKSYGTLTYGRQYAFSSDVSTTYDPMGGAYAFSLIGFSSTLGGGLGDTELARYNNSLKYLYADHGIRAGVLSQVGGWSAGNNAKYAVQGTLGFDIQGFSADGVVSFARDAVSLGVYGSVPPAPLTSDTLKATIQNIAAVQVGAKYKWEQFTLFGGWQLAHITNPDSNVLPVTASSGTSPTRLFNGGFPAVYGTGVQSVTPALNNAFPVPKNLTTAWVGGKYAVLKNLDLAVAYYWVHQNDYLGSTETPANCAANTSANAYKPGTFLKGTSSSRCAGDEHAISGLIDWKPYKRLDIYAGAMYSKVSGGLASGFFVDNNLAVTGGARFSF